MIETAMVPVIIRGDAAAQKSVDALGSRRSPAQLARALQPYTVQIPARARELLLRNGHASFHHPELRGDQFCVLDNHSLYHGDTGLWWEHAEYLGEESWLL